MIDAFVRVVEKLIQLATYREQGNQRVFKERVAKLYDDLQIVHTDHLQMLESCYAELISEQPLTHVAEPLTRHRIQYREFFSLVTVYLIGSDMAGRYATSLSSRLLGVVKDAIQQGRSMADQEVGVEPDAARNELIRLVYDYLENTREHWLDLSQCYAKLLSFLCVIR